MVLQSSQINFVGQHSKKPELENRRLSAHSQDRQTITSFRNGLDSSRHTKNLNTTANTSFSSNLTK
jgi:hypothetical protein